MRPSIGPGPRTSRATAPLAPRRSTKQSNSSANADAECVEAGSRARLRPSGIEEASFERAGGLVSTRREVLIGSGALTLLQLCPARSLERVVKAGVLPFGTVGWET